MAFESSCIEEMCVLFFVVWVGRWCDCGEEGNGMCSVVGGKWVHSSHGRHMG